MIFIALSTPAPAGQSCRVKPAPGRRTDPRRASPTAGVAVNPAFRSPAQARRTGRIPGGAVDSSDASLIAAALREAQEEVAIPPSCVEVIGVLPPVDSVTGFQVTLW